MPLTFHVSPPSQIIISRVTPVGNTIVIDSSVVAGSDGLTRQLLLFWMSEHSSLQTPYVSLSSGSEVVRDGVLYLNVLSEHWRPSGVVSFPSFFSFRRSFGMRPDGSFYSF